MKKSKLFAALMAITGLAVPAIAQTQTNYIQSTTVVGATIKDARGEEVGVIKDFVLDRTTGCLAYVVISTGKGGTLTTTETKTVAAPWTIFSASSEPKVYVTRIERERLYSAPVWEATRVEEYTRPEYLTTVYSYYGVSAGVSNTTATGVTSSSTGISSSTGATSGSATPAPTTAGSTPMSSPKSSPTSSTTAHPVSSPLGTPERSAAPRMTAPASSPKMPASTRGPTRESTPSVKTESGQEKKSEKETGDQAAAESQSHSSETKKQHGKEPHSHPETAPTPKQP